MWCTTTLFPEFSYKVAHINAHLHESCPKYTLVTLSQHFGNNEDMSFSYWAAIKSFDFGTEDSPRRVSDSFAYLNPTAIT